MEAHRIICYQPQVDYVYAPYSFTLQENRNGALFMEEDGVPIDQCDVFEWSSF